MPTAPAELFQAGRKVGELRSVAADGAGWIGLALVVLLQLKRTEALSLAADVPGNVAVVDASSVRKNNCVRCVNDSAQVRRRPR